MEPAIFQPHVLNLLQEGANYEGPSSSAQQSHYSFPAISSTPFGVCGPEFNEWVTQMHPHHFAAAAAAAAQQSHHHAPTPSPTPRMGDLSDDSDLEANSPTPNVNALNNANNYHNGVFFGDHFTPANFVNMGYGSNSTSTSHSIGALTSGSVLAAPHPIKLKSMKVERMEPFPADQVSDFKHVIYNLLVEYHNNPEKADCAFVQPCTIEENGVIRSGFCFNQKQNPEKRLPELYAYHIRKARLELEDPNSIFIQDLYKFYLRASLELLSKYFEKRGKYTFLYEDLPLFKIGNSLEEAEERIKNMRTRARMMKKRKTN